MGQLATSIEDEAAGPSRGDRRGRGTAAPRRARSQHVIEELYRQYSAFVRARLRRAGVDQEAADDIHQDAFLVLDREIRKNGVPKSVASMLAVIADHLIRNHRRVRGRRPIPEAIEIDAVPSKEPDSERRVAVAEHKEIVAAILARLPADAAMLIRLIDLEGTTCAEAAELLGRPFNTVRVQHHRARVRFRALAERLCPRELRDAA